MDAKQIYRQMHKYAKYGYDWKLEEEPVDFFKYYIIYF